MAIEITEQEKRELAELLKPMIQADAVDVSKVSLSETLVGVSSIPVVRRLDGITSIVRVPVAKLKGAQGDKGDGLEFSVIASFYTLEELKTAYPTGGEGLFKVGDILYIWTGGLYEPLNLDVFRSFDLKSFIDVLPKEDIITVDHSKTPYAKVVLSGENRVFSLEIINTKAGSTGNILVHQTGFKQISLPDNIKGTIDLPLNAGTVSLLSYNVIDGIIYIHSNTVLGDIQYPVPQKIKDLQIVYSDSSVCSVLWTAPWANNIYDKATEYDMRYSNSLVDANDLKVWSGLSKVKGLPFPEVPGTSQRMTVTGLNPNKEYYLYIKTKKINFGAEYVSEASDFVYFRTLGREDLSKAYRINLSERNIIPQYKDYQLDTNGDFTTVGRLVDESSKNTYLDSGYPDTKNKDYTTYWLTYPYSRIANPYFLIYDLFEEYSLDKIFVYSRNKPAFSVWGMKNLGFKWEKVGEIRIGFNEWKSIDFFGKQYRFLKFNFDLGGISLHLPTGQEGFPQSGEYNGTIKEIHNVVLYGRPVKTTPEGILPPLRKVTTRKTVDQFFCTNGHAYQRGRIHSMCSGEKVRLYIHYGQFSAFNDQGQIEPFTRVADAKFRLNKIPWIGNSAMGENLADLLKNTYKKYGLKPYLTSTGYLDVCIYDKAVSKYSSPVDDYWLPDAWRPVPSSGVDGLDKYFGITMDALHYGTYGKLCYSLAGKYGKNHVPGDAICYDTDKQTGYDLICGLEPENEPDASWNGWIGYRHADEMAAMLSNCYDGHVSDFIDEAGVSATYGLKKADNMLAIFPGTAGVNMGYFLSAFLWWKANRKDASIPIDVFSTHMYFSNIGNQGSSQIPVQYGITFEEAMSNPVGAGMKELVDFRNRYCPDKEIWLTEFGWGESGGRNTQSKYQCYTQPGRYVGNWAIPDRHRSEVKGAWTIRACVQMMAMGVDLVNYYSTEMEASYFNAGYWGTGGGYEMFHWNDIPDATPGAKAAHITQFEHAYPRGGFASMGFFGPLLNCGGYPISRAYWWIATLRNRLNGYVYTGMKYLSDERIVIACFKHTTEAKGAYIVYYNDNQNTGVPDVEIPLPSGLTQYKHVTVYMPNIPSPENVPVNLGLDEARTGLSGATRAIVNGVEVVTLPSKEQNPYFPIVGPVGATENTLQGGTLGANQYLLKVIGAEGVITYEVKYNQALAWKQADAVCDYIEYSQEGIHGRTGDEVVKDVVRGGILTNVSEFPEFYFFDAIPEPDFKSEVTDLCSRTVSSSTVELWWNNTSTDDTGYQIFVSNLPETGYSLLKEIPIGVENKVLLAGLSPNTTYYYKVRPIRGTTPGTLSSYTSAKTFSDLPAPTNFRASEKTATSIKLEWGYVGDQVADFVYFAIYRADETSDFVAVKTIEDKSILSYTDSNLPVGKQFTYKIRAVGLNGLSDYSEPVSTRTMLPEECSPSFLRAITDKLGSKILLYFDLPLSEIPAGAKSLFTLVENGNLRLIQDVRLDEANSNVVSISIPTGSLGDYASKSIIAISYSGNSILSSYGIVLAPFPYKKVVNVIGNFSNIEAEYRVNFCNSDSAIPSDSTWNNLAAAPSLQPFANLTDTHGRTSNLSISAVHDGSKYKWGSVSAEGKCAIEGIPSEVYTTGWNSAYGSISTENSCARLKLSGLKNENRYTVKLFGGLKYGGDRFCRIKINGTYSETINIRDNTTTFLTLENCVPDNGLLYIDVISMSDAIITYYPMISFAIIEEYASNDNPENTDVVLRDATIVEDSGSGVTSDKVTVHLNCVGVATGYRISESQNIGATGWLDIIANKLDVSYALSSGFGPKTLYVQVRNQYTESNVRVLEVQYIDTYEALVLNSIYINNNAESTSLSEVDVLFAFTGKPTHYMLSESATFEGAAWVDWSTAGIKFAFSSISGTKTVYGKLKDSRAESGSMSDSIIYNNPNLVFNGISINANAVSTTDTNLSVAFDISGAEVPTMMMLSELATFEGAAWIEYANPAIFAVTGTGEKTVYAKLKVDETKITEAKSDAINVISQQQRSMVIYSDAANSTGVLTKTFGPNSNFANGVNVNYNESYAASYQLVDTSGANWGTYTRKISDITGRLSKYSIGYTNISLSGGRHPVVTGNMYEYPDILLKESVLGKFVNSTAENARIAFVLKGFEPGTYKVEIIACDNSTMNAATAATCYVGVNNLSAVRTPITANVPNKITLDNVVVDSDGDLTITAWTTQRATLPSWGLTLPFFTVIKVTKVS